MARSPARLTRQRIVTAARGWIGTPYQHQASLKGVGADCLGLLRGVWRDMIGEEPEALQPYTPFWAEFAREEALLAAARRNLVERATPDPMPGSVLIFRFRDGVPAKHCGIAVGANAFIHAHDGASVAEVALIAGWRRRIVAVFDFPDVKD